MSPQPGSPKRRRLAQLQRSDEEGQPGTQTSRVLRCRVDLAGQDSRKRYEKDQGDKKTGHASGTQR